MPLEDGTRRLLDALAAAGPALGSQEPAVARAAARERRVAAGPSPAFVELPRVEDRVILGALPIRIYDPGVVADPAPVVFFHGGGFVLCDIDSHDGLCRRLALASGRLFVSVDYRLAPEHPFPAAVDDALAATAWVDSHRSELGAGPTGLAVAGDSAGGNLAAVVALSRPDIVDRQALLYPVLDHRFDTASYVDNATGYHLTADAMRWFWGHYLAADADGDDWRAAPLRAPDAAVAGAPPALVVTAEYDPLRDEALAYGERLVAARVRCYDGMFHGFLGHVTVLEAARRAEVEIAGWLRGDVDAVQRVQGRYFSLMDAQRWDEWADVFTPACVLELPEVGETYEGRDAIVGFVRHFLDGATSVHAGSDPVIDLVAPDRATAVWVMTDRVSWPGRARRRGFEGTGRYHVAYARDAGGAWRIDRLRLERDRVDRLPL